MDTSSELIGFTGKAYTGKELHQLRKKSKLNAADFWAKVGLPEAVGKLYENRNTMPPLVCVAVELVHELNADIGCAHGRLWLAKLLHQKEAIQALGNLEFSNQH